MHLMESLQERNTSSYLRLFTKYDWYSRMINIKQTTVTKQFNSTVHCAVVTLHKMSKPTVAVWMKSDD